MSIASTQYAQGYVVTCTSGTGVPVLITLSPKQSVKIVGISCGGSATTDITTVWDGNGALVFKGGPTNPFIPSGPQLAGPIRASGLQVGFAGGTAGTCIVYIPSGIY